MYSSQPQGAQAQQPGMPQTQPAFYAPPPLQFPQLGMSGGGFGMSGIGGRSMGSALSFVPPPMSQKAAGGAPAPGGGNGVVASGGGMFQRQPMQFGFNFPQTQGRLGG